MQSLEARAGRSIAGTLTASTSSIISIDSAVTGAPIVESYENAYNMRALNDLEK